jgi:hypothetical protein
MVATRRTSARPRARARYLGVKGDVMPYYRVAGEVPRKRHIRFRGPAGKLYAEELMGEEGFGSVWSLL